MVESTGGPSGDEHYNLIVSPPSVWPVDVRQAQRLAPARERFTGVGEEVVTPDAATILPARSRNPTPTARSSARLRPPATAGGSILSIA